MSVWHLNNSVDLDGIQRGESKWNVGGVLPKTDDIWEGEQETQELKEPTPETVWSQKQVSDWEFTLIHVEEWDPSKGSVSRNFPDNQTQALGDKGVVEFFRESGEIQSECSFPLQQKVIYSEHCSEVQSLIIGYSLMNCAVKVNDDSYFYK